MNKCTNDPIPTLISEADTFRVLIAADMGTLPLALHVFVQYPRRALNRMTTLFAIDSLVLGAQVGVLVVSAHEWDRQSVKMHLG